MSLSQNIVLLGILVTLWLAAVVAATSDETPSTLRGGANTKSLLANPSNNNVVKISHDQTNNKRQSEFIKAISKRRHLNRHLDDAPSWFRDYRREFGRVVDLCLFLARGDSSSNRYHNTDPDTGDICKIKRRKPEGYWCGIGEQTCTASSLPGVTTHPITKCFCDPDSGLFQCTPYDPCDEPEDTTSPVSAPDVSPPTPVITLDDPFAKCGGFASCRECLADGCAWAVGSCIPQCGFIADVACYQGLDADQQCSAMEAAELDSTTCSAASADCETCRNTMKPSSGSPCLWLDFGSGNAYCASFCGMLGCGTTNGLCEPIIQVIEPIAIDGRPFTDHVGATKMAQVVENELPLWSLPSAVLPEDSSSSSSSTLLSKDRRQELAEEWKRRAVGEHSSIASFAAFTIALMTNQAPPDLVEASLVAAMDEVRHAQVSFEMASLLSGSTIEPSSLPSTQHAFRKDLTTLAIGVAKEGCVDETLSALVLATSVDGSGSSDDDGPDDPMIQLLAEKTTQIAKEEGNHSVLAWRTIHWICSMEEEACAAVLNDWLVDSQLESAGEARFETTSGESVAKNAWQFIHKQLVPMVTKSGKHPSSSDDEQSQLLLEEGSLVAMLAHDIVDAVRAAIGTMTDGDLQTSSAMNCSNGESFRVGGSAPTYDLAAYASA